MKLTFRDLKQQKFVIEAEPSETVGEVKEKIAQEKGWEASQQKLIYSGKILQDGNTIESYNIEEKGFIVCMISKPKAAPSSSASASSKAPSTPVPAAASSTPAAPAAPAVPSGGATTEAPATPSPAGGAAGGGAGGPGFGDPSALAMGNQSEGVITQMESMGFERPAIERAMRAAFYNPDRAIDYLLNGIPEGALQEQQQRQEQEQPAQQPAAAPETPATTAPSDPSAPTEGDEPVNLFEAAAAAAGGQGGGGAGAGAGAGAGGGARAARAAGQGLAGVTAGGEGGAGGLNNLEFLRNNPHFQQLRQLVQQQPQMLEPILQQLGAGNPQLAQLIGQNQEQFLQLLSEDIEDDSQLPPGAQTISVTEEERDAIERLCRLGFPRDSVIQAYFACDKNEELAANFLFDQPDEGDDNQ